ncbi:hypothetical protein ACJ72_08226, partial [Emergomyces africanus]
NTLFYLRVWTFGYEDVWLALSAALNTQIHVDRYQMRLYQSLSTRVTNGFGVDEAPYLCGFRLGNSHVPGCLTLAHETRIHSCEPGMVCSTISKGPSVYITPIVSRTDDGAEIPELGAGGGKGDLYQNHELELQDDFSFQQLLNVCSQVIQDQEIRTSIIAALSEAHSSKSKSLSLDAYGIKKDEEISVQQLVGILSRGEKLSDQSDPLSSKIPLNVGGQHCRNLPNTIRFPYSRHSSYAELCNLVKAFKPQDIVPCTVNAAAWDENVAMGTLFGHLCSGTNFSHDEFMRRRVHGHDGRTQKRRRMGSDASSTKHSTQRTDSDILFIQENDLPPIVPSTPINSTKSVTDTDHYPEMQIQQNDICPGTSVIASQQTSQDTSLESIKHTESQMSSLNSQIIAIKRAMKEKHLNHELEFHLPSSFSDLGNENENDYLSPRATQTLSQSQNAVSLSLPISEQCPSQEDNNQTPLGGNDHHKDGNSQLSDDESTLSLPSSAVDSQQAITPSTTASARKDRRIAAYHAARNGTYEAWSSFYSPVSAGNNHTEEEVEL